jgi:energy-coupling factor transporter ATP-binding protein EcfA2
LTEYFLKVNKINSCQVDEEILKKAKKSFQKYKAILLTGRKKSGKTSIAVALASVYKEQECLLLKKPHDIDKIDFPNICLVIIDEFAGKYRYEENEAYEWYNMFDLLYNTVVAGQLNVIITCEKGKLDKCINEIGRHAILDHVVDVPLQKAVVKSEATERKSNILHLQRVLYIS